MFPCKLYISYNFIYCEINWKNASLLICKYRISYENGTWFAYKETFVNYQLSNYQFESSTTLQTYCRLSGWNIFNYPSLSLIATFTFKGQNEGHRTPSSIFCKGNSFLDRCNTKYSKNRMFQITIPPGQKYAFATPF